MKILSLLLFLTIPLMAQENAVYKKVNELQGAAPNINTLANLFKLRSKAPNAQVKGLVVEAVALGLIKLKNFKTYNDRIKQALQDPQQFEGQIMLACRPCNSTGIVAANCFKCSGSRKCSNSSCVNGRTKVRNINGSYSYSTCLLYTSPSPRD